MTDLSESSLLTRREYEVALLVARGLSNKQIAQALVVSQETVKNHISNVMRKFGAQNRAHVAAFAVLQYGAKP